MAIFNTQNLRFLVRGGLAAALSALNEIPLARELIIATDTGKMKVGDGVTNYNSIPVFLNPEMPVFHYTSETANTTDSDPGSGLLKWNNSTQSSATVLYFDDATADTATDLSSFFSELAASSTAGIVHMTNGLGAFKLYKWTAVADGTGYFKFTVTHLASSGSNFADNTRLRVAFHPMPPVAGGGGADPWTWVIKTADTTRTSTSTYADDPDLTFALTSGVTYNIQVRVFFDTNATPDFKYQANFTGTYSAAYFNRRHTLPGASTANTNIIESHLSGSLPATTIVGTGSGIAWFDFDLVITTTSAGTFSIQWAQDTSNAANTIVKKGSFMKRRTIP